MKSLLTAMCIIFCALVAFSEAAEQDGKRHFSVQSLYLHMPVEGIRRITLVGDLSESDGEGWLELDPNACELNYFGDRETCTEIATSEHTVRLVLTRTADPLGLRRQLWAISDTSLNGTLFLIVPDSPDGSYRLMYVSRSDEKTVIATEPLVYEQAERPRTAEDQKCKPLAKTIDEVEADARLRRGFVDDTYFLFLDGRKPRFNTWVSLKPAQYKKQPKYWRIDVLECRHGDIDLPTISPYSIVEEVSKTIGTKGVELHWAGDEIERIDKPDKP